MAEESSLCRHCECGVEERCSKTSKPDSPEVGSAAAMLERAIQILVWDKEDRGNHGGQRVEDFEPNEVANLIQELGRRVDAACAQHSEVRQKLLQNICVPRLSRTTGPNLRSDSQDLHRLM